ncbi:MAG: glycosyltransferase [Thermoplasmata archaeon]
MISSLSSFGAGVAGYTTSLAAALRAQGDSVLVQSDRIGSTTPKNPLEVQEVWTRDARYVFQNFRAAGRGPPYDVIHIEHEYNLFGGPSTAVEFPLLPRLLRRRGKPVVTTLHHAIPLSELPALTATGYVRGPLPVIRRVIRAVTRRVGRWSDHVVVHSAFAKDVLTRDYGFDGSQMSVIPHGVSPQNSPLPMEEARHQLELPAGPLLLSFGYLAPYKEIETLIDAFNLVAPSRPDLRLVICGGVPMRYGRAGLAYSTALRERVEPGVTSRVLFPGFVPTTAVGAYFCAADLVVISYGSSFSSSGALAVAEGFGRPVLAPRIGAFVEAVEDPRGLFELGSPTGLADRITTLLDSPTVLRSLSDRSLAAGKARAWPKVAAMHQEVYRSCLPNAAAT